VAGSARRELPPRVAPSTLGSPNEIIDSLFPDLPVDERAALGDMLDRGLLAEDDVGSMH